MMDEVGTQRCADNIVDSEVEFAGRSDAELVALIEAMQRDVLRLNGFLNATALAYGWCGEYELRLDTYNKDFEVIRLAGRQEAAPPRRGCTCDDCRRGRPDPYPATSEIRASAQAWTLQRIEEIGAGWRRLMSTPVSPPPARDDRVVAFGYPQFSERELARAVVGNAAFVRRRLDEVRAIERVRDTR